MCPFCIGSAMLMAGSLMSTGGLTALGTSFVRRERRKEDALNKMDDTRLMSMWSLTKNGKVVMSVPRIGFIRWLLMNHTYHHRGQLSMHLRMLDVPVPSIYGPSADENSFA